MIYSDTLVYDIETQVMGKKPDSSKDRMKLFVCYSYKTKKVYTLTSVDDIQRVIDAHRYLVGFNNEGTKDNPGYDNPILKREGVIIKYKTIIDLRLIFLERASIIKIKEGLLNDLLMQYSLDFITKTLHLVDENSSKMKIDYSVFYKSTWTAEEMAFIKEYAIRDVEVTRALYEWVENYFESFEEFIREEDVVKKVHLTNTVAKFAYKAICKELKWEEQYGNYASGDGEPGISGGYVSFPAGEYFSGAMYCLDFNSMYPHAMIQANLYGRRKQVSLDDKRPVWNGGGVWKVEGFYYSDKLSGISELIAKWYAERVRLKKEGNRKEYALKILMNIIYGILNNEYYQLVNDKIAGGDCTRLGRQWIKYARKYFKSKGYKVLYTDTDSVYILDPFNDKERLLQTKKEIIDYIKSTVPFPQATFDMGVDDEIKYMYFFKGENKDLDNDEMDEDDYINKHLSLMKKNYIYVTTKDKIVIKNLGIRKKSNTPLSRKIFWDYLVPQIKQGQIKFSKTYLRNLMIELLEKDITLALLRKDVSSIEAYSKSPNGLQAQLAKKYGPGIHFVIANTKGIGVGKGKNYCTIEEFRENKLNIGDIDFDNFWNELDYFIKPIVQKNIFGF